MTTTSSRAAAAASALALSALVAGSAAAQSSPGDARWQSLAGCWQAPGAIGDPGGHVVCIVPVAGTAAAEVVTFTDGRETTRERLDATGAQVPGTKEGCSGWSSARWSAAGDRLYLRAEYACAGGVTRRTSGLLALSPEGELLDVEGMGAGARSVVRVLRYREAPAPGALAGDMPAPSGGRFLGAGTARAVAAAALTTADVIEASHAVDAEVVAAWLVERHEGFDLDARQLVALADAGVPGSVTDMMVALSYPKTFAVNPVTGGAEGRPAADSGVRRAAVESYGGPMMITMPGSYGFGGGYYGGDYGSYYSRLGYPYAYGNGYYGAYGWYPPGGVVIVKNPDPNAPTATHGRVVNGRGYTNSGDSDRERAVPRQSRGSSSSDGGSSGSSTRSGAGSSSGGSSAPERTAKPRP